MPSVGRVLPLALAGGLALAATGVVFAAAEGLGPQAGSLGAESLSAAECDTDGITVGVNTPMNFPAGQSPGFTVVRFALTNVDGACNGKHYAAALQSASGSCTAEGTGTLAVSAGAASVDVRSPGCTLDWNTGLTLSIFD